MTISSHPSHRLLAVVIAALFAAAPALAGPGEGHGNKHEDKAEKHAEKQADKAEKRAEKAEKHAGKREREDVKVGAYFDDRHREAARAYYSEHYSHAKNCPPGLAKKNNGCMPPGQARKWAVGEPVPRGVTIYSVPQPVLLQLPPPPYGYRYARIGNDIVLVQSRNNVIVDIIQDLLG
jgi:Ni/Co efflux regulator RcnB